VKVRRIETRLEFVAGLLLFAMIFAIGPIHHLPPAAPWPSKELIDIALFFCLLAFGAAFAKLLPATPRPPDTAFNLLALVVILFLILVPEAFYAVYLIFGRIDFSHTRLSILLLLPLCSLFAIYLAELKAMVQEALHAADELVRHGVQAEIIDLRSVRPLDEETILQSIRKTGHLVVADTSWELCGVASEIAALAAEKAFSHLKAPVLRIALANCPAPVSLELEQAFYPKASTIARAALATLGDDPDRVGDLAREDHFKGPY
jgi:Transketolase, C-terminal domain